MPAGESIGLWYRRYFGSGQRNCDRYCPFSPYRARLRRLVTATSSARDIVGFWTMATRARLLPRSLETKRDQGRGVVHIVAGPSLPQKLPNKEVGIVRDQYQVAINFPIDLHLRLASDIGCPTITGCSEEHPSRVVGTVVHALSPEEIDLGRCAKLLCQLKIY